MHGNLEPEERVWEDELVGISTTTINSRPDGTWDLDDLEDDG